MIDLTLDAIKIPILHDYTPPFGTTVTRGIDPLTGKDNIGGLNIQQVNDNIIAPFVKMRAVTVSATDSTSQIEYDAKLFINASSAITLTLNEATYIGCRLTLINSTNLSHTISYPYKSGGTTTQRTSTLLPNGLTKIVWNGTSWQNVNAPIVGKTITQYPQEYEPAIIYPCTSWEEVTKFEGAFFRANGGNAAPFINEGQTLTLQTQATSAEGLSFSGVTTESAAHNSSSAIMSLTAVNDHSVYIGRRTSGYGQDTPYPYGWDDEEGSDVVTGYTDERTITIPILGTSGTHLHSYTASGSITSSDTETRPINYTKKIWIRTY